MRHAWANTLLLVLLLVELATGFLGLVYGSADDAAFMATHRIAGFGIVVLLLWKVRLAVASLGRRRGPSSRLATIALSALLLVTLLLGFAWSVVGSYAFAGFSGLSWHIYVGAGLAPLLAWHSWGYTRGLSFGAPAGRRSFLRLAGVAVLGTLLWQATELGARATALAGASRRFTGSYPSKRTDGFPTVSWLNDVPPSIEPGQWSLAVSGAVERPISWGYADLAADSTVQATIDCTGGWYSEQLWAGVPLSDILESSRPNTAASSVTVRSVTGYNRRFSLEEADGYLLATHVGGRPLDRGHGFPARLVAPGKRGFEWVKWVTSVEVNESSRWLQWPLPLQ